MKHLKRYAALCMALVVVCSALAVPSFATDYQSTYNFWNWAYDNSWFLGKAIIGFAAGNVCQVSEDGMHHATTHSSGFAGGGRDGERVYNCVCDLCGQEFQAVATDLQKTYDDIVNQYEYNSYSSDGSVNVVGDWVLTYGQKEDVDYDTARTDHGVRVVHINKSSAYWGWKYIIDCSYDIVVSKPNNVSEIVEYGGSSFTRSMPLSLYNSAGVKLSSFPATLASGQYYFSTGNMNGYGELVAGSVQYSTVTFPVINIVAFDYPNRDINIPSTFSPSFSYTDESGSVVVFDNQIIDETNLTYYNPVTNTTTNIQNWSYDYSDRSYTVLTDSNNTTTITYGDEYITINEGDNITYNIYYYTEPDSSGGGSGGSGSGGEDDGDGIGSGIGELLGSLLGGLIDLITGIIGGLIDSLINLVEMTTEKLGQVVNLFGSFGEALKALWSWLPEEIITILAAGVSVVVFASVIKLFV